MKKLLLIGLIIGLILVSGCSEQKTNSKQVGGSAFDSLSIYTHCEDGIVCYFHKEGYGGGMSCFKDKDDLLMKYCDDTEWVDLI